MPNLIETIFKKRRWTKVILLSVFAIGFVFMFPHLYVYAPDEGQLGGPIKGLTPDQLRMFYDARDQFKHEFTPEEGLGPVFNGRSCWECHGQPGPVGGEGRDVVSTGAVHIRNRVKGRAVSDKPLKEVIATLGQDDVDRLWDRGGPVIQKKSITVEFPGKFPADCNVEASFTPPGTEIISLRHAGPVFGFGLLDAVPDKEIIRNMFYEYEKNPKLSGRSLGEFDGTVERTRTGRFGWKSQQPNLMLFNAEALVNEHDITTYIQPIEKMISHQLQFPLCLKKYLPAEPNDEGPILNKLTYFESLLAPPQRGPITPAVQRGEQVFNKLECAVCHTPVLYTPSVVYVPDPRSLPLKLQYLEVKALENQSAHLYSDLLVHQMGTELADGVPMNGARGGEWRTTPLWGLRLKKFLLHDGRARTIEEAIEWHGGQSLPVTEKYRSLPPADKADLLAFLKSL